MIVPKMLMLIALMGMSEGSENGQYYVCDTGVLASDNLCKFVDSGSAPWTLVEHNVDRSGADYRRQVVDANNNPGRLTPRPWTNGDDLVTSNTAVEDDLWTYALLFELAAPLRNKIMYHPEFFFNTNDQSALQNWNLYTKVFADCRVKEHDETFKQGWREMIAYGTDGIYGRSTDPNGEDIHHNVLQYLEEGVIDLVCITTDLSMDRCNTMRSKFLDAGRCDCWFSAYEAMYGAKPAVDLTRFTNCTPDPDWEAGSSSLYSHPLRTLLGSIAVVVAAALAFQ